jgi:hypothetical protein
VDGPQSEQINVAAVGLYHNSVGVFTVICVTIGRRAQAIDAPRRDQLVSGDLAGRKQAAALNSGRADMTL